VVARLSCVLVAALLSTYLGLVNSPGTPSACDNADTQGGGQLKAKAPETQGKCDSFLLVKGEVLRPVEDLVIEAATEIDIQGTIVGADKGAGTSSSDGVSITLVAGQVIRISGSILAGHGMSAPPGLGSADSIGYPAGRGGSIMLDAPVIIIEDSLVAGNGGIGGAHRTGGKGGDLSFRCSQIIVHDPHTVVMCAGDGGSSQQAIRHDIPGGAGGAGGDVAFTEHDVVLSRTAAEAMDVHKERRRANRATERAIANPFACPTGDTGEAGAIASAGSGGEGPPAANGTASSPQGATGNPGGPGGNATGLTAANNGQPGEMGGDCCPDDGGQGGTGGASGGIHGGNGGKGGRGGDGYYDISLTPPAYVGPKGHGGNGGNGGSSVCGSAGKGGKGGPKLGRKGDGGTGIVISGGAAGDPGEIGLNGVGGNPQPGNAGTGGAACTGQGGGKGAVGDECQ